MQRQAPGLNGGGGNAAMAGNGHMVGQAMPMGSGQQMDLNMMYQKLMELSEVLKENREKTQGIVTGAEELAVSSHCCCLIIVLPLLHNILAVL